MARQADYYSVEVTDTNGCTTISNPVNITGIAPIANAGEPQVLLYPNPFSVASVQLAVSPAMLRDFPSLNSEQGCKLKIYDAEGRIVFQSEIRDTRSEITLNVSRGV